MSSVYEYLLDLYNRIFKNNKTYIKLYAKPISPTFVWCFVWTLSAELY